MAAINYAILVYYLPPIIITNFTLIVVYMDKKIDWKTDSNPWDLKFKLDTRYYNCVGYMA
jgi:hypothetical protein